MSTLPKLYTVADLEATPDDANRYEIIEGELIVSPPPSTRHQLVQMELGAMLRNHVVARRIGRVFVAPLGVRFSLHDQVEPNVVVVLNERRGNLDSDVLQGGPDLAIEILSPSNRSNDLTRKFRLYERNGVPEYWIVDPVANTIRQFVLRGGHYADVANADGILRSAAIPDFTLDLAAFFRELEW